MIVGSFLARGQGKMPLQPGSAQSISPLQSLSIMSLQAGLVFSGPVGEHWVVVVVVDTGVVVVVDAAMVVVEATVVLVVACTVVEVEVVVVVVSPPVQTTGPVTGAGDGATSQGVKSAFPTTVPQPPVFGPVTHPHQLHSALTVPVVEAASTRSPPVGKFTMLLSLMTTLALGQAGTMVPLSVNRMPYVGPVSMSLNRIVRLVLHSKSRTAALPANVEFVMLLL